jgi:pimeloyl-ACP methyl ester carboxylesterase
VSEIKDYIVLLHGLGRGPSVMAAMDKSLKAHGFDTHNIDYPSTELSIQDLSQYLFNKIQPFYKSEGRLHFVCHSLGGLIARYMIMQHRPPNLGRMVMLGPPNQGTDLVDFLRKYPLLKQFYRWRFGPAGQQMGTDTGAIHHRLAEVDYDVGVIAGDLSVDWLFSWLAIKGRDDGKVSIENTKMANMKDHIVVHAAHPFISSNTVAKQQALHFLQHGMFSKS